MGTVLVFSDRFEIEIELEDINCRFIWFRFGSVLLFCSFIVILLQTFLSISIVQWKNALRVYRWLSNSDWEHKLLKRANCFSWLQCFSHSKTLTCPGTLGKNLLMMDLETLSGLLLIREKKTRSTRSMKHRMKMEWRQKRVNEWTGD